MTACPRCQALDELLADFQAHGGEGGPASGASSLTPDLIRALVERRARDLEKLWTTQADAVKVEPGLPPRTLAVVEEVRGIIGGAIPVQDVVHVLDRIATLGKFERDGLDEKGYLCALCNVDHTDPDQCPRVGVMPAHTAFTCDGVAGAHMPCPYSAEVWCRPCVRRLCKTCEVVHRRQDAHG